jgi:hypothetical protein
MWQSPIPNIAQISQQIWNIHVEIHLSLTVPIASTVVLIGQLL